MSAVFCVLWVLVSALWAGLFVNAVRNKLVKHKLERYDYIVVLCATLVTWMTTIEKALESFANL